MSLRRLPLVLGFLLTAFVQAVSGAVLQGEVAGVIGSDVRLTVEGEMLPQPGDVVTISFEIPGGPKVVVGTWKVTSIDGDSVLASKVDATGAPAIGQIATIVSPNPVARRPKQVAASTASPSGGIRVRYQGQVYETLYQHQTYEVTEKGRSVDRPIDLYFFAALDAGAEANGTQRFNRFVRDPAEGHPDVPTWWYCRWVSRDGDWHYDQTKVDGVTVLRTPVDAAAYEASVWNTTSIETGGDRKGQAFASEMTMTTANGITRMSSSTAYAEGRIVGDRFTFSSFKPDGTGPVGEGWCVFSGNAFSGGWTATNGRSGTWEGKRVAR